MDESQSLQRTPFGRNNARLMAFLLLLVVLSFTIMSCSSVSEETYLNAGSLLVQNELNSNYDEEFGPYWRRGAEWQGLPSSAGKLEPERMPDWASEQYEVCVYWEDEYRTETTVARPGDDLVRIRQGVGWGWILLGKDLNFHILETNLRWTVTEDGVETESVNRKYVDAWDAPEEET
ncbi:hypothetical protein KKG90_06880 [Candidatus Bipolaricaulota bacterium]|nr:hypothetical protein [Candidatus Bipolaricaulota bacterium]